MSNHLLCEEPTVAQCKQAFRLSTSKWIDGSNFGQTEVQSTPPAGIRLRWNCPFLKTDPMEGNPLPKAYTVWRSDPLDPTSLVDFKPSVGHVPRCGTPKNLWQPFKKLNSRVFVLNSDNQCDSVDAVYFKVPADVSIVTVSLTGLDGKTKVIGDIKGDDEFYFEHAGIVRVVFSADVQLQDVLGLFLAKHYLLDGINFKQVARIDAEVWPNVAFEELLVRLANSLGQPFSPFTADDWEGVRLVGQRIVSGYQSGTPVAQADIDGISVASGLSWEVSILMGLGFTDGEHPAAQRLDTIIDVLQQADSRYYAYYISAEFEIDGIESSEKSTLSFTEASLMAMPGDISVRSASHPVTRSQLANPVEPSEGEGIPAGPVVEQFYCSTEWELRSELPDTEIILTIPKAKPSTITGEAFIPAGEFYSGSNPTLIEFVGLSYTQRRIHNYRVPYFDSDVWLEQVAVDSWGRKHPCMPSSVIQPDIEYNGNCLPLSEGNYDSDSKTIALFLKQAPDWRADALAANSRGKISLLIKDPTKEALTAYCQIGPAYPNTDGNWAGDISQINVQKSDVYRLINGTLNVEGFVARIISIVSIAPDKWKCVFEATVECAGAILFNTPLGFAKATLIENQNSPNLWLETGTIDLLLDGSSAALDKKITLSDIEGKTPYKFDHSMTLHFATRIAFNFKNTMYLGRISPQITVSYLHPAPKVPEICFELQHVATDYYGRRTVQVSTGKCPALEIDYQCKVRFSPGVVIDEKAFVEASSEGLFGPQQSTVNRSLWEVFPIIDTLTEGSEITVGISYIRGADSAEGLSKLDTFEVRKTED